MKIIELDQRTTAWIEWRKGGVCASDIAAICGVNPYKTALDIYHEKIGDYEQHMTAAMQRGVDYEAEALEVFIKSQTSAINVAPCYKPILCEHNESPLCKASLDGYNEFSRTLVEIKIPGLKVVEMARYKQIPLHYEYQIQWQLYVSGANMGYYFVYHPESLTSFTIPVYPNDNLIDKMVRQAEEFWKCVCDRTPPVTTKRCNGDAGAILKKMIELKHTQNSAEREYKEQLALLLELEGEDMDLEGDNAILAKAERATIDYKQACVDAKIDLEKYKKPKTFYWTLREKK